MKSCQGLNVIEVGRRPAKALLRERKNRPAQTIPAHPQVNQNQNSIVDLGVELRCPDPTNIGHRRQCGEVERHRGDHRLRGARLLPLNTHAQRVFANRDGEAQSGATLHGQGLHCIIESCVLTRLTTCGHPVGAELDLIHPFDRRCE